MLFSIIIPVYNKEKGIKASIRSILNQPFDDYEVIVVDDGSTDHSIDIIRSIKDERIRLFQQPNSGPSSARNNGIKEATGEWILFLDADDELVEGSLNNFTSLIDKYKGIRVICCNHFVESNGVTWVRSSYNKEGIVRNNFFAWFFNLLLPSQGATIFHKDIFLKHNFPEYLRRWEDVAMLFEIMREERFVRSPKPSFIYHRSLSQGMFGRKDINEDYLGHLSFSNKSFWEKMCLCKLYDEARNLYPLQIREVYPKDIVPRYVMFVYYFINTLFDIASFIKKVIKKQNI